MANLRLHFLLFLMSWSLLSFGGTISITGNGEASHAPDEYRFDIIVTSICYETTKAAQSQNSTLANQIIELTQQYKLAPNDKITTSPGGFIRSTEYVPTENDRSKIICENRWKTWNTIRLTLHDFSKLPGLQEELTTFLGSTEAVNIDKKEQTYVQISSPQFSLTEDNLNKTRKLAQQSALMDAKNQLQNFNDSCDFRSLKLMSVAVPTFDSWVRYGTKSASISESSTPVIPEEITVTAAWSFTWEFDSAPRCYN